MPVKLSPIQLQWLVVQVVDYPHKPKPSLNLVTLQIQIRSLLVKHPMLLLVQDNYLVSMQPTWPLIMKRQKASQMGLGQKAKATKLMKLL